MFTQRPSYLPWFMWFFPVLFFTYQFILRLWPGLMMPQIMAQFSIDASHFGVIAAFYYYGYAGMQIPVALLLVRFETRTILFVFALMCGLATLLFTYSHHWYLACLSRFLVGAGSAVGFLGVSNVISEWFPKCDYTKMVGYSFTIGLLGAIYGGKPISVLVNHYSWTHIALALALISVMIGVATYCFLRSKNPCLKSGNNKTHDDKSFKFSDFKTIVSSPILWILAIANLLMVGALEGFSDVWGVPYLITAYNITKSSAAQLISFVFLGMLFGGPFLAWCSKKLGNYHVIALCGFGMALVFTCLLLTTSYHGLLLAMLFFLTGVMCCYQVIVFAVGAALVQSHQLGVTIAFLNCVNMLGGSFFHTIIGKLMDFCWTGFFTVEGIRRYDLLSYHWALMVIPICASIGATMVYGIGISINRYQKSFEKTIR